MGPKIGGWLVDLIRIIEVSIVVAAVTGVVITVIVGTIVSRRSP